MGFWELRQSCWLSMLLLNEALHHRFLQQITLAAPAHPIWGTETRRWATGSQRQAAVFRRWARAILRWDVASPRLARDFRRMETAIHQSVRVFRRRPRVFRPSAIR